MIEKLLREIYTWEITLDTCGTDQKVFPEEIQKTISKIDALIKQEDPDGSKMKKADEMGEYPESEWDSIWEVPVVSLMALKNYAEKVLSRCKNL